MLLCECIYLLLLVRGCIILFMRMKVVYTRDSTCFQSFLSLSSVYSFIFASACKTSMNDTLTNSLLWFPHHAAVVPMVAPHAFPQVTKINSLAKPQASGMHVALDRLPAPSLAAARHHASNAVTATRPRSCTGAGAAPAVTGPRWGSSTALPTLIHCPTGWKRAVGVADKITRTNGKKDLEKM